MAAIALRKEERVGLILAGAAHVALIAFLVWRPIGDAVMPPPERMTVTLSDEVGLTSTSPEPAAAAAPDIAPDLGEPAPAEPEPAPPAPQPTPAPPKPAPSKPLARAVPPPPPPRPAARPAPLRPTPKAVPTTRPAPARAQPRPHPTSRPAQPPRNAGASRIGDDFLKGVQNAPNAGASRTPSAQAIGPAVQASLRSAISRQLKPRWTAPQGADAEMLVTLVRFRLARDGTLLDQPEVVGQSGVTPANSAQKARHAEQAIRAVRLAAPFDLPDEYYSAWQTVTSRFDRKLSQ